MRHERETSGIPAVECSINENKYNNVGRIPFWLSCKHLDLEILLNAKLLEPSVIQYAQCSGWITVLLLHSLLVTYYHAYYSVPASSPRRGGLVGSDAQSHWALQIRCSCGRVHCGTWHGGASCSGKLDFLRIIREET